MDCELQPPAAIPMNPSASIIPLPGQVLPDAHAHSIDECLIALASRRGGLTQGEVVARRERYGRNALPQAKRPGRRGGPRRPRCSGSRRSDARPRTEFPRRGARRSRERVSGRDLLRCFSLDAGQRLAGLRCTQWGLAVAGAQRALGFVQVAAPAVQTARVNESCQGRRTGGPSRQGQPCRRFGHHSLSTPPPEHAFCSGGLNPIPLLSRSLGGVVASFRRSLLPARRAATFVCL